MTMSFAQIFVVGVVLLAAFGWVITMYLKAERKIALASVVGTVQLKCLPLPVDAIQERSPSINSRNDFRRLIVDRVNDRNRMATQTAYQCTVFTD